MTGSKHHSRVSTVCDRRGEGGREKGREGCHVGAEREGGRKREGGVSCEGREVGREVGESVREGEGGREGKGE